jgi:Zn-dependent protease with chaperone function
MNQDLPEFDTEEDKYMTFSSSLGSEGFKYANHHANPTVRPSLLENQYLSVMNIISVIMWLVIPFLVLLMQWATVQDSSILILRYVGLLGILFFYGAYFGIYFLLYQLYMKGYFISNAIELTPRQLPEVYQTVQSYCQQLGMAVPKVFVIQSGGLLNAFATRLLGKSYVVLYSDILEMAYTEGKDVVDFVIAHELAHIKLGHLNFWKRLWLLPALCMPLVGQGYSRSREISCDRIGQICSPEGAEKGLLVLAGGKTLYKHFSTHVMLQEQRPQQGFIERLIELFSMYPSMMNRIYYCFCKYEGF